MTTIRRLIRCTAGASAIEYAVIASLISVAAIGAFLALGSESKSQLNSVNEAYESAK